MSWDDSLEQRAGRERWRERALRRYVIFSWVALALALALAFTVALGACGGRGVGHNGNNNNGECGDGVIDSDEDCDGTALGGASCVSLGYPTGSLGCTADCQYDLQGCQGSDAPVIQAIEGTGPSQAVAPRPEDQAVFDITPGKQLAQLRISSTERELLLTGIRLSSPTVAQAMGQSGQGNIVFDILPGGTDTMLRIRFPQVMTVTTGGLFLLSLVTPHGTAEAQVFFLQGQDGTVSNTVNGDLTVTGNLTAASATLGDLTAQSLQVTGTYSLPPCPPGYEEDLSAFGGLFPAVHVCMHPTSGDAMVRVGDFWIDRYEASLWSHPTCTGTQYGAGTADDYPAAFPDTGNVETPVHACSLPGVVPSRQMTWFQAEQACAAMGKRLCTNAEWQIAVAGTFDPGAAEVSGSAQCRVADTNTGPRSTGQVGAVPASASHCISRYGAEDMIGNLWEWVADWGQSGDGWTTSAGSNEQASVWGSSYGDDSTWNVNGSAWHSASSVYTDGIPAAWQRGGAWDHRARAGAFALSMYSGPGYYANSRGVRCCRGR